MIHLLMAAILGASADPVGAPFAWTPRTLPAIASTREMPGFEDYVHRTGWIRGDSASLFGAIPFRGGRLAVHLEIPRNPRGTVLLVHGYMDHSGLLSAFERHLLQQGWAVCAPDLPGHGLSSGARGDVDSFADYGAALGAVLDAMDGWSVPGPRVAVGHSTGGAALLSAAGAGEARFRSVALVAPLVRIHRSGWVRAGLPWAELFADGVDRRTKRRSTHDAAWHERMIRDPLEIRRVPYSWVHAALDWEKAVPHVRTDPGIRWLLVRGDRDEVVDGESGETILRGILPRLRVVHVQGGLHHLLNEAEPWRSATWDSLDFFLGESSSPFHSAPQ